MLDEALRNLRLDRRLMERRGWVSREELARALATLADVASKVAPVEEEPPAAGEPAAGEAAGGGSA